MDHFFVSPVESLLLGFAWGEYLHDKKRPQEAEIRFLGQVADRLSPFLPDFRQDRTVVVSEDDLPQDIEWLSLPDSTTEKGFSPTSPDRVYCRHAEQVIHSDDGSEFVLCKITDSSRKTLMDLVASYLGDLVATVPADHVALNLGERDDSNKVVHELIKGLQEDWTEAVPHYATSDKEDNVDGIDKALNELIAYNECSDYFSTGKYLGTLLARCWSEAPEDQFTDDVGFAEFTDVLEKFLEMKLMRRDSISTKALRHFARSAKGFRGRVSSDLAPDFLPAMNSAFLKSIQHHRLVHALWIALGEMCSLLDDVERVARGQEWEGIRPRTFRDLFDQSGDKVRQAIADAERSLNETSGDSDLPQRIVSSLAPAIEAIVRRTFVFSDSGHTAREMMALLSNKLHQGSVSERKFASVAIGLHTQYRNAATHEYERFSCSFEEARYFVAGLRVLMTLCEQIAHKK